MRLSEYDLDKHEGQRVPSPGRCIYCLGTDNLTDEHVIPFALGANTIIFRDASCRKCAETIQPYEQEVLRKQLGVFRAQVDAPSRNKKKSRIRHADLKFVEIDDDGRAIRDLGKRNYPIEEVPLTLALWQLPEASKLKPETEAEDDHGKPWAYCDMVVAQKLNQSVAAETGSRHTAVEVAEVNRGHFLRFLAKTAHAFAVAALGLDAFRPFLKDIILNCSDDFSKYVGGGPRAAPHEVDPSTTTLLTIGQVDDGPAKGLIVVRLQIYPQLGSPAYIVIVGEPLADIEALAENFSNHAAR
jgi:hypothetical protein